MGRGIDASRSRSAAAERKRSSRRWWCHVLWGVAAPPRGAARIFRGGAAPRSRIVRTGSRGDNSKSGGAAAAPPPGAARFKRVAPAFRRRPNEVDARRYAVSKRARHNHQFSQLVAGSPRGACGGGAPGANATIFPRPRHEAGTTPVESLCAGGADALRHRILEILRQPRIFVGLVEDFDAALLALQRETGLPDVTRAPRAE